MNLNSNVVWTLGIFSDRPQSAGGGYAPSASSGPPGSLGKADPAQRSMLPAGTVEAEVMLAACRFVGAVEPDADGPPRSVGLSALCQAQLDDGRRETVPADRGWPTNQLFSATPVAQIEETARMGVGPDERLPVQSPEHAVRGYWLPVHEILSGQHVMVPFDELPRLPHGVVLGLRLREMLFAAGV